MLQNPNPNNVRGYKQGYYIPTNKEKFVGHLNKEGVPYRSSLELKFMRLIDANPNVEKWTYEHPDTKISYFDPMMQKQRTYYPDFWMQMRVKGELKTFLIEVKPYSQTQIPKRSVKKSKSTYSRELQTNLNVEVKRRSAEKFCAERGWKYLFVTEKFFA